MYKLDLPIDYKEAAAIERRKKQERTENHGYSTQRLVRSGVDLQALEQQRADKEQYEEYERRRQEAFAADAVRNDKISCLLQQRQDHDLRELNKALNEFRAMHQQPHARREWDLYDPDALKKDKPARVSDDDPRCTISGLQKFDGEDLNNRARQRFQQEQAREWLAQQQNEKDHAKRNQEAAERLYQLKQRELDERALALQEAEEQCRRALDMAQADYNKALAREQAERARLKAQQDLDDKYTEIANHIFGDILTENPAVAQSAFGPHRVITDRWKGMTPQQLEDIRRQQEIQRQERERRRQEEELRDKEWDRQRVANARASELIERENNRKRTDIDKSMADENRRLAQEQKAHIDYLSKEVYTNRPTAEYFMQFNTTTR